MEFGPTHKAAESLKVVAQTLRAKTALDDSPPVIVMTEAYRDQLCIILEVAAEMFDKISQIVEEGK